MRVNYNESNVYDITFYTIHFYTYNIIMCPPRNNMIYRNFLTRVILYQYNITVPRATTMMMIMIIL